MRGSWIKFEKGRLGNIGGFHKIGGQVGSPLPTMKYIYTYMYIYTSYYIISYTSYIYIYIYISYIYHITFITFIM